MPDIVHEVGISMLENGRLRHGSYCAISFLMHCLVFSELLEAQTSFKSDHVLMFLEQVTDPEGRRYHLFVWFLITDHWASSWDLRTDPRNQCCLITSWIIPFLKHEGESQWNFSPIGKGLNPLLSGSSLQAEIYVLAFWRRAAVWHRK